MFQQSLLRWSLPEQMWVAPFSAFQSRGELSLGRGVSVLPANLQDRKTREEQERLRQTYHHGGPYLPMVMSACSPHELCLELRHGTIWYGAFTYALAQDLRIFAAGRYRLIPKHLLDRVDRTLMTLGLKQPPRLAGPSRALRQPILRQ
jgi:hypothetical protein